MADFRVGAATDLPIRKADAWDGAAAERSMFEAFGFNGGTPQPDRLRRGYLVYDAAAPKLKGSYHLPFALVVSGTLTASQAGLRAAASRLPQMQGLDDATRNRARSVIDGYQKKLGTKRAAEAEDWSDADEYTPVQHDFPALVVGRATGTPTERDTLLELARARALDPTIFDEPGRAPFFFRAEVSNNLPDTYFTRMHESSLRNYAQDAEAGVPLLNAHGLTDTALGRSLTGQYVGPGGDGRAKVLADFYITPGTHVVRGGTAGLLGGGTAGDPVLSDVWIDLLRSGQQRGVSVGFLPGTYECSICKRELAGRMPTTRQDAGSCWHLPGRVYPVLARDGKPTGEQQLALAWVKGARLHEVSTVTANSTPHAFALKAQRMADAGLLTWVEAREVEQLYQTRIVGADRHWAGFRAPERTGLMTDTERQDGADAQSQPQGVLAEEYEALRDWRGGVRAALAEAGIAEAQDAAAGIRQLAQLATERRLEIERLKPLAEDGRQYKLDLVERALIEGVRAHGDQFNRDSWARRLSGYGAAEIKEILAEWTAIGQARFSGGRAIVEATTDEKPRKRARVAAAYRA